MGTVSQSPVVVIGCAGRQAAGTWAAERSERQRKPRAGQNLESVIWYQGGADSNISTKLMGFILWAPGFSCFPFRKGLMSIGLGSQTRDEDRKWV